MKNKVAVLALGGNAITRKDHEDTIPNQFINTKISLQSIMGLIREGYNLAISHGNGPQVGNAVLRVELARGKAPELPLYICVADLQGGMGYMIEQVLRNSLNEAGIDKDVATIVTQVMVDLDDDGFKNPTKFIGQFYDNYEAEALQREFGWTMKKFPGDNRMRRVIASPKPQYIVERSVIKTLVDSGKIVIASGGGGIPVVMENDFLRGVDAVIDKDKAAAVMARDIGAELLMILTSVEKVALDYSKPSQRDLDKMTLTEAKKYLTDGHFPAGSMGPKIEAAIEFLEEGGRRVVISSIEKAFEAFKGEAGTSIIPD